MDKPLTLAFLKLCSFKIKLRNHWERGIQDGGGLEATLTSYQDQYGITNKLWRNHPEQTPEE